MSQHALVAAELEGMSESLIAEVLDFCLFLKARHHRVSEEALLSEATLAKDWLTPEEEEAWSTL